MARDHSPVSFVIQTYGAFSCDYNLYLVIIHPLSFLSQVSRELRGICRSLIGYGNPGELPFTHFIILLTFGPLLTSLSIIRALQCFNIE